MKRLLKIGDVVRISAKNKEYADLTYEVRIVEVSDKMAKGRQVMYDGSITESVYFNVFVHTRSHQNIAEQYWKWLQVSFVQVKHSVHEVVPEVYSVVQTDCHNDWF